MLSLWTALQPHDHTRMLTATSHTAVSKLIKWLTRPNNCPSCQATPVVTMRLMTCGSAKPECLSSAAVSESQLTWRVSQRFCASDLAIQTLPVVGSNLWTACGGRTNAGKARFQASFMSPLVQELPDLYGTHALFLSRQVEGSDRVGSPETGMKRECGADLHRFNAAAVPATVSGERDIQARTASRPIRQPLGRTLNHAGPGKAVYQAMTHEPGDLPASGRSCLGPGDGRGTVNSV